MNMNMKKILLPALTLMLAVQVTFAGEAPLVTLHDLEGQGTATWRVSPPPTPPRNVADFSQSVRARSFAATLRGGGLATPRERLPSLEKQARATAKRAAQFFHSIATKGGYVGNYSLDLKKRYGEGFYEPAKANEIWVQPPGTPSVGEVYLRALRVTGDSMYLNASVDAGRALAWGQRKAGGWDHLVDVGHMNHDKDRPVRNNGRCSFDDDVTQSAISFLMDLDQVVDQPWVTESVDLGLQFIMKSQFPNGAWPQWYPLIGGYHDDYTFNDGAINDCIKTMLNAYRIYGKEEYLNCAKRGGDFIILSQLPPPQAGWAQQYTHDLKPAWARTFEPPGVCSAATANNIRTLIDLYLVTKEEKYLAPIPNAIAWLERSKIGADLWARLYEVGTNRPVYGDREDGNKVHYDYAKISERERTSYGWQGSFGIRQAVAYYARIKSGGGKDRSAHHTEPLTPRQRKQRAERWAPRVREAIAALDGQGRWAKDGMIDTATFVKNMNLLCDYLELFPEASTNP